MRALPLMLGAITLAILLDRGSRSRKERLIPDPEVSGDSFQDLAISMIKRWEEFSPNAYPDPANPKHGPVTIGYGTTRYSDGSSPKIGDKIDAATATKLLIDHVNEVIIPKLEKIPIWNIMDNYQRSSLISFAYNLGANLYGSSNFKSLNKALDDSEWYNSVPKAMQLYVWAGGKKMNGLVKRRLEEAALWNRDKTIVEALLAGTRHD